MVTSEHRKDLVVPDGELYETEEASPLYSYAMAQKYKLVVIVPLTHADIVRKAIGEAGAGKSAKYSFASFSAKGIGRFMPEPGAYPAIGEIGKLEEVEEERIECQLDAAVVGDVIAALKRVHPYEEIAYDLYPLESWEK